MKSILCSLACAAALALPLSAATINGTVAFATKRGQHPVPTETLVRLESAGTKLPKPTPGTFQMVTRGKALDPHVLAIPRGSTVSFPNDDPISHNLFSLSSGNSFDLGLYRKGAGKSQVFDTPGIVNVYCNVHPSMSAVIHVLDTPYYAFADATGKFSLNDIPAGKYRLVAWNEQGGETESPIEVGASGNVTGQVALTIDSRNYRLVQHLNKLGKPYEPPSLRDY